MTVVPEPAPLAISVVDAARRMGVRVAVAESLTGGLVADALVSVPGASQVFSGGVIAYDTHIKRNVLGVDAGLLQRTGPVDQEVARQMARAVREVCAVPRRPGGDFEAVEVGVATTGVAGPDPDAQTGQSVGTVWICVSAADGDLCEKHTFAGGRQSIRQAASDAAVALISQYLSQHDSSTGKFQE